MASLELGAPVRLRLITIPISHYCEKARWALDRADVPYREERHIQGIHRIASRRAGGLGTVPVLVTEQGSITDSAEILTWVDARLPAEHRLYAADPVARGAQEALCARLDEVLGPAGRRLIYVRMFAHSRDLVLDFNNEGVPRWEDRFARHGWGALRHGVGWALGIRPGVEVEGEATLGRELDHVAQLLSDGRPYLGGERFGAADLTFASLCAPVLLPRSYGVTLPQPEVLDEPTAVLVARVREHAAGAFAMKLIEQHRRERVAGSAAGAARVAGVVQPLVRGRP
jgi:glutathione S-transferase